MGLITWLRGEPATLETRQLAQVTDLGLVYADRIAQATSAGDLAIAAVYRAQQLLSDLVASLPMREVVEPVHVTSDVAPRILSNPNPAESYHQTMFQVMSSLIWRGNAYLWPRQRDRVGNIQSCVVLNPDEVTVNWDRAQIYRRYFWRGQPMERDSEIIHIPINLLPGRLVGVGPVEAARTMLLGAQAEQNFVTNLWLDDATPGGVITVAQKLTSDESKVVQADWIEAHRGNKAPAVMSGGASFTALTMKPIDAQFIEQRNFTVSDVARLFGLSGFFLGVESGGSLTYSTTESLMRLLVTATLAPTYLSRIEAGFSRMLPTGRSARFDVDELLRADIQTRYTAYETGIRAGVLTETEARALEGRPARPANETTATARQLAEIIQKLYLGVGKVVDTDEARAILNTAGAGLSTNGGMQT